MLIEKLSANDIRLIDDYRKNYSFSSEANETCGRFADTPYVLREWDFQKSQYLYKMFGEQFMISKQFNYTKSYEELQDEISGFTQRRYGRVGRSGELFMKEYSNFIYPNGYFHSDHLSAEVKDGLNRLISDDCLIFNKYDGAPFDLDLPDGHKLRISAGCKTSKMLGKIANAFNLAGFEDFRICHSQVLNQKSLTGVLTLSIHPLDFMTMSDNECDWDSCMSWRGEGGYRMGTVEMMNSPASIVAYLSSEENMKMWPSNGDHRGEDDVWNNKKWRQLFVVNENMIISVKDYPYHNSELTKQVVDWIRELAQTNLGWQFNESMEYRFDDTKIHLDHLPEEKNDFMLEISHGAMYNDFGCVDFHWLCVSPNVDPDIIRRPSYSNHGWYTLEYSGRSECMVCGGMSPDCEDESCLACEDCQNRQRCDACGELIHGETEYIDGMTLCSYCYENRTHECVSCGEYHYDDYMRPIFVIPRLTAEESAELMEKYKQDHPYDWEYAKDQEWDECMYYQAETPIWMCDANSDCLNNWVKENVIEGHKTHVRTMRWHTDLYIYFDELTTEAQNDFFEWADNDPDTYKRSFQWSSVYPSRFVEDHRWLEDELPF